MNNEDFQGIAPINFFQISHDCQHCEGHRLPDSIKEEKRYLLPDTSPLCYEESFAQIALGWNSTGLLAKIKVDQPFQSSAFPDITRGDSCELFIDTRDVKTSGYNTRFCHHFFFLPEPMSGRHAGEITHFRTEESHPHCPPESLKVTSKLKKNTYEYEIFIPIDCLYGYDPEQFDRLGFNYRINRPDGPPQHFSCISEEYKIEEQPSLWASLRLVE